MTLINANQEFSNAHKLSIEEQLKTAQDKLVNGISLSSYDLMVIGEQLRTKVILDRERAEIEKETAELDWMRCKKEMAAAARSLFTPLEQEALEKYKLEAEAEAASYARDKAKQEAEAAELNKQKAENDLKTSENNKSKSKWAMFTTIALSVASIAALIVAAKMGKDEYDNQYGYLDGLTGGAGDGLLTSIGECASGVTSIEL